MVDTTSPACPSRLEFRSVTHARVRRQVPLLPVVVVERPPAEFDSEQLLRQPLQKKTPAIKPVEITLVVRITSGFWQASIRGKREFNYPRAGQ